jgi:hypothetical protein
VSHCGGCLISYAARRRIDSLEAAANKLTLDMLRYWSHRNFAQEYSVKSIKLGYSTEPNEGLENSGTSDIESEMGGSSHE